jgi:hypothetical protein
MKSEIKKTNPNDRYFFLSTAIFFLLANLIGFTYSTTLRIEQEGSLPIHIYIHGVCFGLWIMMYFVQNVLIFSKNIKLHKRLGKWGSLILLSVLVSGFYVAFMVPVLYNSPIYIPGRDFSTMLLALLFGTMGLKYRKNPFTHKRLMMFCTLILSTAGIARAMGALGIPVTPVNAISAIFIPAIFLIIYDYFTYKKAFRPDIIGFFSLFLLFVFATPAVWDNRIMRPILLSIIKLLL